MTCACAEIVDEFGPNTRGGFVLRDEFSAASAMSHADLVGALQQALGKTRMIDEDD